MAEELAQAPGKCCCGKVAGGQAGAVSLRLCEHRIWPSVVCLPGWCRRSEPLPAGVTESWEREMEVMGGGWIGGAREDEVIDGLFAASHTGSFGIETSFVPRAMLPYNQLSYSTNLSPH
jgi:hypothetical protein